MSSVRVLFITLVVVLISAIGASVSSAAPEGQMTWAVGASIAPTWFDPAETSGIITPYIVLFALHDGLVKPIAGNAKAPSLAESWSASSDGLVYEFVLRKGTRFHNGEPVTAEDVKFSFERYRGVTQKTLKDRVLAIEAPDPTHVRIRLKQPWPDFITFYSIATGAGWIVPKKYVEKVGDEGFKRAPIGAGPYKFISFTPGVELVLEAFDQYWRKPPTVRRLVLKVIPDGATRLAALKRGEVDIAYEMRGTLGEAVRRSPGLTLRNVVVQATFWVYFADQWDPKSPWHDRRVRVAANQAFDRQAINEAETLGFSRVTGSIIPASFEFYWAPPAYPYDPASARRLLNEAGYPNGFDAGEYFCDAGFATMGESVLTYLGAVGIRATLRPLERAAFSKGYSDKKYRNLIQGGTGALGNAATRIEAFVASGGAYVYGSYPDIDRLVGEQATELDPKRRGAILDRIQQLIHEKAIFAPIWEIGDLHGVGQRVEDPAIGYVPGYPFSAPYEDVKLKLK